MYCSMTKQSTKVTEKNQETTEILKKTEEKEIVGYKDHNLPEPTRYGDWEVKGRCSDF